MLFTILALSDDTAARATKTPYKDTSSILSESRDLLANTTWRFLHDRGYINPDHTLSAWGKVLATSLKHAATSSTYTSHTLTPQESEEAILMAYELLRLDLLNSKHLFPSPPFSGPPLRGSESDKSHTLLVSRIAALGLFRHAGIGYTGPLSRHLLAYHQIASVVRGALRDLLEMHAANLFLSGSADRKIQPSTLTEIGCDLPFVREPDLGLSLVVKSYLDELSNEPGRRSDVTKWFNHAIDVGGDLEKAWAMWEAVSAFAHLRAINDLEVVWENFMLTSCFTGQRRCTICRHKHCQQRDSQHVQPRRRLAPKEEGECRKRWHEWIGVAYSRKSAKQRDVV